MKILKKLILLFPIIFSSSIVYAVSFDCNKASRIIEKAICSDSELSILDDELSTTYKKAILVNPDLKSSQLEWIKKNRLCENTSSVGQCLKNSYVERAKLINDELYLARVKPSEPTNSVQQTQPVVPIQLTQPSPAPEALYPVLSAQQSEHEIELVEKLRLKDLEIERYLIDKSKVLSKASTNTLLNSLIRIEKNGNSAVVVIEDQLFGIEISTYTNSLRQSQNKDIALVIDKSNSVVRVSISDAMSAYIPEQQLQDTIEKLVIPSIKNGDYNSAISLSLAGFESIFKKVKEFDLEAKNKEELAEKAAASTEAKKRQTAYDEQKELKASRDRTESLTTILNFVANALMIPLVVAVLLTVVSVPIAFIMRLKGEVIIIENFTDAAVTLGSIVVGVIVIGSLDGVLSKSVGSSIQAILSFVFMSAYLFWMYVVAKRSNISSRQIWIVAFSRIFISFLPLAYLSMGAKTISKQAENESDASYLIRYGEETEKNKNREKDKSVMGIVIVALTTLSIDKFAFESVTKYYHRRTAFIKNSPARSLVNT